MKAKRKPQRAIPTLPPPITISRLISSLKVVLRRIPIRGFQNFST